MPDRNISTGKERLATIAGHWRTSGYVIGQPNVPVTGTDTYELVPGGHFLLHRVDVRVGEQQVQAIEVIGEPDGHGGYLARSFDSEGNTELMRLTIDDEGVFHLGRPAYLRYHKRYLSLATGLGISRPSKHL